MNNSTSRQIESLLAMPFWETCFSQAKQPKPYLIFNEKYAFILRKSDS